LGTPPQVGRTHTYTTAFAFAAPSQRRALTVR